MSNSNDDLINGPVNNNGQGTPDMTKYHPTGNGTGPPPSNYPSRPPLVRLDSRTGFQPRPGFQPPRPPAPQIRPPIPGGQILPQGIQAPTQGGPIPPTTQFRAAVPGARPPGQPPFPRAVIGQSPRPGTPFPRPPQPRPGLYHQSSLPIDQLQRSHTVDSADAGKMSNLSQGLKGPNLVSTNRAYSMGSTPQELGDRRLSNSNLSEISEERRISSGSIGSNDDRKSISGSYENLDRKPEGENPLLSSSRSGSTMNVIREDDKVSFNDNYSSFKSSNPNLNRDDVTLQQSGGNVEEPSYETKCSPDPLDVFGKEVDSDSKYLKSQEKLSSKNETNNKNIEQVKTETSNIYRQSSKDSHSNLELKNLPKRRTLSKDGDNDSGVDESTQGNDQSSNGDHNSPRKLAGKIPTRSAAMTPTKGRSLSRGSKSPSLKSPDSTATTPGSVTKKLPMNKIQVGSAPSPNLKVVRSKIGSLENASYKPGGGNIKIENKKIEFKNAAPRIEAKNERYTPRGGEKKIQQQKLQWNAKSKIGSLENTAHKPKGGEKKIETVKLDFKEKAKPKVGSKDNMKYVPGGGDIKIENKKIELKVQSKVGSLDNVKHKPGGGEKKIFDDKEYLRQKSAVSSENQSLTGSQHSIPSQPEARDPVADENLNQER